MFPKQNQQHNKGDGSLFCLKWEKGVRFILIGGWQKGRQNKKRGRELLSLREKIGSDPIFQTKWQKVVAGGFLWYS